VNYVPPIIQHWECFMTQQQLSYNEYYGQCTIPNQLLNQLVAILLQFKLFHVPSIVNIEQHICVPLIIQCYKWWRVRRPVTKSNVCRKNQLLNCLVAIVLQCKVLFHPLWMQEVDLQLIQLFWKEESQDNLDTQTMTHPLRINTYTVIGKETGHRGEQR